MLKRNKTDFPNCRSDPGSCSTGGRPYPSDYCSRISDSGSSKPDGTGSPQSVLWTPAPKGTTQEGIHGFFVTIGPSTQHILRPVAIRPRLSVSAPENSIIVATIQPGRPVRSTIRQNTYIVIVLHLHEHVLQKCGSRHDARTYCIHGGSIMHSAVPGTTCISIYMST